MLTLGEYLNARRRNAPPAAEPAPGPDPAWLEFASSLVHSINSHALAPDEHSDLRQRLLALSSSLSGAANLSQPANSFDETMREFQERFEKSARSQSQDMYKMLTMLNEALLLLASGSERTVGVLKQLEHSLDRASTIQEMTTLKSKLGEVVVFLREESKREREESVASLCAMDEQLREVRESATWLRLDLPGREEAAAALENPGESVAAAVFVLDRLRLIATRYGEEAAGDLVQELVNKRIKPLAAESKPFRWSADAILLLIPQAADLSAVNAKIAREADTTFEHKVFAGARVATLKINLRWVVMRVAAGSAADIDRFIEGAARP
jgi:GGDEF domain-containing protein